MTRLGLSLSLCVAVWLAVVAIGCARPEASQPEPTPDVRATVVAEITATALAGESVFVDTSPTFVMGELESALSDFLPASFEEIDPEEDGFADYLYEFGSIDFFSDFLMYGSGDPFQLIVVVTEEFTALERIGLEYALSDASEFEEALRDGFRDRENADYDFNVDDVEMLSLLQVGDKSAAARIDTTLSDDGAFGDIDIRIEYLVFLRGNYAAITMSMYFPATEPSVSLEDIAGAVDDAIMEIGN